jgi:CDP-diacylglycerol--serine O-phosphatidyltransferase
MNQKPKSSLLYILPNLFTLGSLFAGFYAITILMGTPSKLMFIHACIALFFCNFCDTMDGRVARMTGTQSDFGMQMDSLVDLVSFGIAPALLAYKWGLMELGMGGLFAAFAFAACAACRLARFNVIEMQQKQAGGGCSRYFTGLPTPFASGMLLSTILYYEVSNQAPAALTQTSYGALGLVLILSYLMVSHVRFRTFKDTRIGTQSIMILTSFLLLLVLSGIAVSPAFSLVLLFGTYVAGGLLLEVIGYCGRILRSLSAVSR